MKNLGKRLLYLVGIYLWEYINYFIFRFKPSRLDWNGLDLTLLEVCQMDIIFHPIKIWPTMHASNFIYRGLEYSVYTLCHPQCFSFGFLEYSVAHGIHHKQSSDICGPYVVALLTWTSIFECQKAKLVIKNGHQREMCHIENGLLIDIILGSTDHNIIGRTYVITQE